MNIAGATPKDTISDKESMCIPNPHSSSLFIFLATHPSTESKITAININLADKTRSPMEAIMMDKKPEDAFAIENISAMDV